MGSESDINWVYGLQSIVLQDDFTFQILSFEELLLRTLVNFKLSLFLYNFDDGVERLQFGVYSSDISERVLGWHFLKDPLETLKLKQACLTGNNFEANVNFLLGLDN